MGISPIVNVLNVERFKKLKELSSLVDHCTYRGNECTLTTNQLSFRSTQVGIKFCT